MGIGARWTICKSQNCSKYSLIINPLLHNKNNQSFLSWSVMKQLKAILSNYLEREILCIGCAVYSVVSIKRTGSLNYFEVFYHPELFFHALNEIFLPPWSFFHALNEIFAPPCSLITSCLLNRYYRVHGHAWPERNQIFEQVFWQRLVLQISRENAEIPTIISERSSPHCEYSNAVIKMSNTAWCRLENCRNIQS